MWKALLLCLCVSGFLFAETIECEGKYSLHLQGIAAEGMYLYWSFTDTLVKTDRNGKVVKSVPVKKHCGDICVSGGKVYCPVNEGKFNKVNASKDSLLIFDAETMTLEKTYPLSDYPHGFGAVAVHNGHIFVTGGMVEDGPMNIILEYSEDMKLLKRHEIPGHTLLGIQTLNYAFGYWWIGVYGNPGVILCNDSFEILEKGNAPSFSTGMAVWKDGTVFIATTSKEEIEAAPTPENPKPEKKVVWKGKIRTAAFNPATKKVN